MGDVQYESTNDEGGTHDLPFPTPQSSPNAARDIKALAMKVDEELDNLPDGMPVGSIMMWATDTAPAGWLICNGQGTGSYPDLAAVVGATVPDMQGVFPLGAGALLGANRPVKSTGGHADIGSHAHTQTGHTHTSGVGWREASAMSSSSSFSGRYVYGHSSTSYGNTTSSSSTPAIQPNTSANTAGWKNIPPFLALNFIIKH